jgi:hypothetical protein
LFHVTLLSIVSGVANCRLPDESILKTESGGTEHARLIVGYREHIEPHFFIIASRGETIVGSLLSGKIETLTSSVLQSATARALGAALSAIVDV